MRSRMPFRLPPEGAWSPCSVPLPRSRAFHFRCSVVILSDLLLNGQLLILLILLFATDVGEACLLVFINVKDSFSRHRGPLDLVSWKRSVHLLLFWRLWCARAKARRRQQRCRVRRTHSGATGKKNCPNC